MDLVPMGVDLFATAGKIRAHDIGIGDQVFCTGLFSRFVGSAKNMPIVRTGSIALMPDEPVPTKAFGNVEAYLIEVRSLGGLSGSPVFLYHLGPRLAGNSLDHRGFFLLLGLVHGHWDTPDTTVKVDTPFKSEKLNLGIAVVIPAQKILEVIERPELKQVRTEIENFGEARVRLPPD